jgi:hypothetical protein
MGSKRDFCWVGYGVGLGSGFDGDGFLYVTCPNRRPPLSDQLILTVRWFSGCVRSGLECRGTLFPVLVFMWGKEVFEFYHSYFYRTPSPLNAPFMGYFFVPFPTKTQIQTTARGRWSLNSCETNESMYHNIEEPNGSNSVNCPFRLPSLYSQTYS